MSRDIYVIEFSSSYIIVSTRATEETNLPFRKYDVTTRSTTGRGKAENVKKLGRRFIIIIVPSSRSCRFYPRKKLRRRGSSPLLPL